MKIISYNVNGIRAALRKDFAEWLKAADPDVVCLQETKAKPVQIPSEIFEELGYHSYYFSAEKPGYSGVAILTKQEPNHVEYGCPIELYQKEGRVIRADFDGVSVMSVYIPSGTTGDIRQDLKMESLEDFHAYVRNLRKEKPNLVISGDFNICHTEIDIHNPVANKKSSGFLPEERAWVSDFLEDGMVDGFREVNQEPHQYTWWSYRFNSRQQNKGWRIDYHMVTESLRENIKRSAILREAMHSDHAPLLIELDL